MVFRIILIQIPIRKSGLDRDLPNQKYLILIRFISLKIIFHKKEGMELVLKNRND